MNIATILFTYNRRWHTERVLDALSKNQILPQKLYVFQDGRNEFTDENEWNAVGELIKNISWCQVEVHIADKNYGLAESIVAGLNFVFEKHDAVIVLEDDCVTHPMFMGYMISALNKYKNHPKVYSIGGCAWDVELEDTNEDAYFNGKTSSWGWATWKDRWMQYERDYLLLNRIKNNGESNERLQLWGANLEDMILGNITGRCNSWAVFWGLKVIEKGGYCLTPYESLITNIGFDGTGTHSRKMNYKIKYRSLDNRNELILPERIEITEECKEAFRYHWSYSTVESRLEFQRNILIRWVQIKQKGGFLKQIKEREIALWGTGPLCDLLLHEEEIKNKVSYIVESRPKCEVYRGIQVGFLEEMPKNIKLIVVIPVHVMELINRKVKKYNCELKVIGIDELMCNGQ